MANKIDKPVYAVILAGGSGDRLWPLSRAKHPKPMLAVGSPKTLLAQTVDRLSAVAAISKLCMVSIQGIDGASQGIDDHFIEPVARNTGPAVLYSCLQIFKKDPEALALFAPADAYIPPLHTPHFVRDVTQLITAACAHECVVLLGVPPSYAATNYGYIEYEPMEQSYAVHRIRRFHEKPTQQSAQQYVKRKNMVWNTGIFAAPVAMMLHAFHEHAPEMVAAMNAYLDGEGQYVQIPALSIDYALMEKDIKRMALPAHFRWNDVGNLESFVSVKHADTPQREIIEVDAKNCLVDVPKKLVVLVGVHDLCIVETDDALIVSKRTDVEKVRDVVGQLRERKQFEYL